MAKSKKPKPSPEQIQIQREQLIQITELDDQENKRRKQLLSNAAGLRAFKGSALTRATPSNTAGGSRSQAFVPRASNSAVAGSVGGGSYSGRVFTNRLSLV